MPNIKVTENDWDRKATFIKQLVEFIQMEREDNDIISLVEHFRETNYSQNSELSDSDIFLLYCKLLDAKRQPIIETLRFIEDLVEFPDEYSYKASNTQLGSSSIEFSLLAYSILNKLEWKRMAYIQQHKKIKHEDGVKIKLPQNEWHPQSILDRFYSEFVNPYKPYLILGDAYVDFINNRNSWNEKIRATYAQSADQVTEYLGYMAEHFVYALQTKAEIKNIDWLRSYSKVLRNMTEEVISSIKNKRNIEKDEKHNEIYSVSKAILDHLDACDLKSLEALDEKASSKLKDFIKVLRAYVNKLALVPAYTNNDFFKSDLANKTELRDNTTQTEVSFSVKS